MFDSAPTARSTDDLASVRSDSALTFTLICFTLGVAARMNKQELIGAVGERAGLGKGEAIRAVEAVFDTISAQLKKGDEVRLVGFGTFSLSRRKASEGRNPRTGEPMTIKASIQPKFKAGKLLKDHVN